MDFELKNIVHTLGDFEDFPLQISEPKSESKPDDKTAVLSNILRKQRIGYFGTSPFGMCTVISSLTALPFREEGKVYELLDS